MSRKAGMAAPSTSTAGSARPNTHRLLHQPAAPWVRHRNTLGGTPFLRDHVPLQLNDSELSRTDPPNDQVKLRAGWFDVMTRLAVMPARQLQRLVRHGPTNNSNLA